MLNVSVVDLHVGIKVTATIPSCSSGEDVTVKRTVYFVPETDW